MGYAESNVIIMMFDTTNPDSLDNIRTRWFPEIGYYNCNIPIVLVGNKMDLIGNENIK